MTIRAGTDDLIDFLNTLLKIDQYAIAELLTFKVPCNSAMAEHPPVQVTTGGVNDRCTFIRPGESRVGVLGILNGFCGVIDDGARRGYGPIAAVYDEGYLAHFERLDQLSWECDESKWGDELPVDLVRQLHEEWHQSNQDAERGEDCRFRVTRLEFLPDQT